MSRISVVLIAMALAVCRTPSIIAEAPLSGPLTPCVDWLCKLPLPDVSKLDFVEVQLTGSRSPFRDPAATAKKISGFLIQHDESQIELFTHDLYRLKIPVDEIVTKDNRPFRPADFESFARETISKIPRTPLGDFECIFTSDSSVSDEYLHDLFPNTELLVLAALCRKRILPELEKAATSKAAELDDIPNSVRQRGPGAVVQDAVEYLQAAILWRSRRALQIRRNTRAAVSQQLAWYVEDSPASQYRDELQSMREELQAMAKTELALTESVRLELEVKSARARPETLTGPQLKYLVYCLRDYNLNDGDEESVRDLLIRAGAASLPYLIDGIGDRSLTRTLEELRHNPSPDLVRVHDWCVLTIAAILGDWPKHIDRFPETLEEIAAVKSALRVHCNLPAKR